MFTPREDVRQQGGQVILRDVTGKAEVYLDGKLSVTQADPAKQTVTLPLAANPRERTISILIEAAEVGQSVGLGGPTTVE